MGEPADSIFSLIPSAVRARQHSSETIASRVCYTDLMTLYIIGTLYFMAECACVHTVYTNLATVQPYIHVKCIINVCVYASMMDITSNYDIS